MEILQYILSGFWTWVGAMFLIWQIGFAASLPFYYIYKGLLLKREQFRTNAWLATPNDILKAEQAVKLKR